MTLNSSMVLRLDSRANKPKSPVNIIIRSRSFNLNTMLGFRSLKRQPKIIFETITIIKKTKITIEGDSQFDFVCRRDQSTDKGDVRPPNEVDKDVPVTDSDDYYDDELTTTEDNKKKEDDAGKLNSWLKCLNEKGCISAESNH